MAVQLDGVVVEDGLVRHLARLLEGPLARRLDSALVFRAQVVGLTTDERAAILRALENAPPELHEVRAALLAHERWHTPRRRIA